jgi:hypothetical protein
MNALGILISGNLLNYLNLLTWLLCFLPKVTQLLLLLLWLLSIFTIQLIALNDGTIPNPTPAVIDYNIKFLS